MRAPGRLALALLVVVACRKTPGELRTVDVAADAPGSPSRPASVTIALKNGELHVTPGGAHVVGGAVRSNVSDLDPKVDAIGEQLRVAQGPLGDTKWSPDLVADWRLTIGPTPIDLTVDAGAAEATLELGGLAIQSLRVKTENGPLRASFAGPNPLAAHMIDLGSVGGAVTATDVARFGAPQVRAHSDTGAVSIDLGAKIDRDVEVELEAGTGPITVRVPAGVTARAKVVRGSGAVTATGWTKEADVYLLGAPGATPPRVAITIKGGTGAIVLVTTP
jgi:hypothetical protein